eukprot:CAMPEP_0194234562 /NCGR_PEP_ID=MMETSP0158-20130606/2255_1 /TAXON_ID=33649 /ORGANISM="Thalassionema nitzschioides, Strain L26-B" /LENGTH=685 /DNA_ID=CAMNT_0038967785 /DNA_START=69 /DNA_END=2126 /DNA_ORIENTATION=-
MATAHEDMFTPHRISHASLFSANKPLLDSLTTDGLVSITDIPGFRQIKENTLKHLHECLLDSSSQEEEEIGSSVVLEATLNDGTLRRTIASATIPTLGAFPFPKNDSSPNCKAFQEKLQEFRSTIDKVTLVFANQLGSELDHSLKLPLMSTKDGEYSFHGVADIVGNGEHLEHFHSYEKLEKDHEDTIELHTDQGLFIAFTPSLYHNKDDRLSLSKGDFYIETAQGDTAMVEFSLDDDLVFMLGDGVNQYINPKFRSEDPSRKLRATPHYVTLDDKEDAVRVWFGRMVLPPSDAYSVKDDKTYGEIRRLLSDNKQTAPNGLGCSSIHQRALDAAPQGDEADGGCPEGKFQCWFRCMDIPAGEPSIESCTDENDPDLSMKCINPRGQVSWDGMKHGDYYPKCTNSTAEITDVPSLPSEEPFNYPQDEDVCTDGAWSEYLTDAEDEFDFVHDLTTTDGDTAAKFFWSVVDNDDGSNKSFIKGRLSFNGLFGWIAFGFANTADGAKKNGMNGAQVLMATPGSPLDYSPVTGFDLSKGEEGFRVAEYVIDHSDSAFRHWQDPVGPISISAKSASNVNLAPSVDTSHECFTSLDFYQDRIHETEFNTSGMNTMLWAANGEDSFAGYHGRGNRAVFDVEWKTGEAGARGSLDNVDLGTLTDSLGSSFAAAGSGTMMSLVVASFLAFVLLII